MNRPDFSGRWRFVHDRSRLQIPAPDETRFVIEHNDPALRLSRTHVARGTTDTFTIDLTTDGREAQVEHGDLVVRGRVWWDGEVLEFDSVVSRGALEGRNVVRYELAPGGDSIIARERFRSPALNYDNIWVLEREPES